MAVRHLFILTHSCNIIYGICLTVSKSSVMRKGDDRLNETYQRYFKQHNYLPWNYQIDWYHKSKTKCWSVLRTWDKLTAAFCLCQMNQAFQPTGFSSLFFSWRLPATYQNPKSQVPTQWTSRRWAWESLQKALLLWGLNGNIN